MFDLNKLGNKCEDCKLGYYLPVRVEKDSNFYYNIVWQCSQCGKIVRYDPLK